MKLLHLVSTLALAGLSLGAAIAKDSKEVSVNKRAPEPVSALAATTETAVDKRGAFSSFSFPPFPSLTSFFPFSLSAGRLPQRPSRPL
jgi:hypothetical protein